VDAGGQRIGVYPERIQQTSSAMYLPILARITPGFLESTGLSLIRGRDLAERDIGRTPCVILVNETAAFTYWPDQEAIGKKLVIKGLPTVDNESLKGQYLEVIGIVKDAKIDSLSDRAMPYVFMPFDYYYSSQMRLIAGSTSNPTSLYNPLIKLVKEIDPNLTIVNRSMLNERIALLQRPIVIAVALTTGLGCLGLALAGIGIYGTIAYSITRRIPELGIRIALGATQADILLLVVGQGMKLVLAGTALGLLVAWVTTQFLSKFLFGITPRDSIAFIAAPIVLDAIALVACIIPASHAIKVDPVEALRNE
jgi:putative ABC transport system permease protein